MLPAGEISVKSDDYRSHPEAVALLAAFHRQVLSLMGEALVVPQQVIVPGFFIKLIAILGQDTADSSQAIHPLLFPSHCDERFQPCHELFFDTGNHERLPLPTLWQAIFEPTDYLPPLKCPPPNRRKRASLLNEVKDLSLLGPRIAQHLLCRRDHRQRAMAQLRDFILAEEEEEKEAEAGLGSVEANMAEDGKKSVESVGEVMMAVSEDNGMMNSEVGADRTPASAQRQRRQRQINKESNKKGSAVKGIEAALSSKSNLSSFFTITTVNKPSQVSQDFFQPFFLKPNCQLAPICHFSPPLADDDGWERVVRQPRQVKQKRRQATCLGLSTGPLQATMKLLQFHDNYRPAYWGTLRMGGMRGVNPRRPCLPSAAAATSTQLDYQVDSDEEWAAAAGEGEEGEEGDAESIDNSEEDGDDDEDDEEGEGEEEGEEGDFSERGDPPSWLEQLGEEPACKRRRGKLIILQPTCIPHDPRFILGWLGGLQVPLDPWQGVQPQQYRQDQSLAPLLSSLPEELLPSLATLLDGSSLGLDRLYAAWATKHPTQTPSKRHFMLRINQLARKEGGKQWILRPEYAHLKL